MNTDQREMDAPLDTKDDVDKLTAYDIKLVLDDFNADVG